MYTHVAIIALDRVEMKEASDRRAERSEVVGTWDDGCRVEKISLASASSSVLSLIMSVLTNSRDVKIVNLPLDLRYCVSTERIRGVER